jgi:hypothetical protein
MTWLLRLYPCEWRRRYGAEVEEVLAQQSFSYRVLIDLLGGAIDAHLKPQAFAQAANNTGAPDMIHRLKSCDDLAEMSPRDTAIATTLTLLSGLVVAAILILGSSRMTEIIALTMSPAVLVAPTQWMMTRGHSAVARIALIAGPFAVCFLIGLAAALYVAD